MTHKISPTSAADLLQKANELAGLTLGEIAASLQQPLPPNFLRAKGLVGKLIEMHLGATAGNRSVPDFENLGIELKTIPVTEDAKPYESTYVCTTPLANTAGLTWEHSRVKQKLAQVLWIPIQADPTIPSKNRCIGMPLLWQPSAAQEASLKQDWEELIEMITLGQVNQITAHRGAHLQIRPKAANASALREGIDEQGRTMQTLPRGFYLRATFTQAILAEYYQCL